MDTLGEVTNVDFRFKMREAQKIFLGRIPERKKGALWAKKCITGAKNALWESGGHGYIENVFFKSKAPSALEA